MASVNAKSTKDDVVIASSQRSGIEESLQELLKRMDKLEGALGARKDSRQYRVSSMDMGETDTTEARGKWSAGSAERKETLPETARRPLRSMETGHPRDNEPCFEG